MNTNGENNNKLTPEEKEEIKKTGYSGFENCL